MCTRLICHRTTVSTCKPVSFWDEKRDTVVIYYEVLQKCPRVKTSHKHRSSFGIFQSGKGSVTSNKNNWATYAANKE